MWKVQLIEQLFANTVLASLLIYPVRRIFRRAGLNPSYGFLLYFPYAGLFIVSGILALVEWPSTPEQQEDGEGI